MLHRSPFGSQTRARVSGPRQIARYPWLRLDLTTPNMARLCSHTIRILFRTQLKSTTTAIMGMSTHPRLRVQVAVILSLLSDLNVERLKGMLRRDLDPAPQIVSQDPYHRLTMRFSL
jgi:hypothetical protein